MFSLGKLLSYKDYADKFNAGIVFAKIDFIVLGSDDAESRRRSCRHTLERICNLTVKRLVLAWCDKVPGNVGFAMESVALLCSLRHLSLARVEIMSFSLGLSGTCSLR